ncbi:P-loop NTPase [Micromonospora sp. CPCC 205714]|uniref:P-loop NTPase n=1 Tax=Micromonospora sp. CPCC 205714 TaxID=3122402 RepID=UPI002FEF203E
MIDTPRTVTDELAPSGGAISREDAALALILDRQPTIMNITPIKSLSGGFTDASVLVCDVAGRPGADGEVDGQYVLKVSRAKDVDQGAAHQAFWDALPQFAQARVPRLVVAADNDDVRAELYEIAGNSLRTIRTADLADYRDLRHACGQVAGDLLEAQLAATAQPAYRVALGAVLEEWVPNMYTDGRRRSALRRVAGEVGAGDGLLFVHCGEHLPNPHLVWGPDRALYDQPIDVFRGRSHGDLHLKNILLGGALQSKDLTYWLIDLSWDTDGPLLYDQAYLEVSAFLNGIRQLGSRSPLAVFSAVDDVQLTSRPRMLPTDHTVFELIQVIRQRTEAMLATRQPRRQDVWRPQYPLARVAAGLNWAAKPIDQPQDIELRIAAFLYAAWASKMMLTTHFSNQWASLVQEHERRGPGVALPTQPRPAVPVAEAQQLFEPFLSTEDSGVDLFLVADEGLRFPQLTALAGTRWSVVVDLDPGSDAEGLSAALLQTLRARRSVVYAGRTLPHDHSPEATVWLYANGWVARSEPRPETLPDWRRTYLPLLRRVIDRTIRLTAHRAAAVLVLRSGRNDDKISRVLEYLDECYGGEVRSLDLAIESVDGMPGMVGLLDALTPALPLGADTASATVPGVQGSVPLSPKDLLWLGVDLEVLHSAVLSAAARRHPETDEFWRGRPPTWVDLAAGLDVPRELHGEVVADLGAALSKATRPYRVELVHSPGAGGTTLARRVAWDLSAGHPTALLKQYSSGSIDRIDELHRRVGRPLLLVVEAGDLTEAEREDLLTGLDARGIPVVVLWVSRTTRGRRTSHRSGREPHRLVDPMRNDERREFARLFRPQAETDAGRQMITRLGSVDTAVTPVHSQQLSPFFFGLCAYEQNFAGIETFVRNHLVRIPSELRLVAQFLALVTRYAQSGIPTHLVRFWITGRWTLETVYESDEDYLRSLLGDDLRHLTVSHSGELRLMHPQIAEQVLQELLGGEGTWRRNLPQLSVDLIANVVHHLGAENVLARRLLENLFVRRTRVGDQRRPSGNFSELVEEMPQESAQWVLQQLTEHCPNEPHFWNHLGRHQIYRMRSSFENAEKCLLRAVELSEGRDSLHLHTLGMVRRLWIEHSMNKLLQDHSVSAQALLDEVLVRFRSAMEAFDLARRAAPNSEYAYITPVQLTLEVLERLVRVSGHESLPDLINSKEVASEWVAAELAQAEDLLDQYRSLRANQYGPPDSDHFRGCEEKIKQLYSNIDHLITQWRAQLGDTEEKAAIGRALARAYIRQGNRDWSSMDESTLRTIAECLDAAIRVRTPSEAELRNWFQAYRRLPEYNELRGLERVSSIAEVTDSLEASYYLYVLHFMRWRRGEEFNQDRIRAHMDTTDKRARYANRQWSYEWVGRSPDWCPLAHFSELGEWANGFWNHPQPLDRVAGVIQEIEGPERGWVRIGDGRLRALFRPRDKFRRGRDEYAYVDFFLGFSYEGLRAWEVEVGGQWAPPKTHPSAIPAARRRPESSPTSVAPAPRVSAVKSPPVAPAAPAPVRRAIPQRLRPGPIPTTADPAALIGGLLDEASGEMRLIDLGETIIARFGQRWYDEFKAGRKLRPAIQALGLRTEQVAGDWMVSRQDP